MHPDRFFAGVDTHMIGIDIPIMVSDLRLQRVKKPKRATAPVMIDSGSFTIHDRGRQFCPASRYVDRVRRYQEEIGQVVAVATYGRMCEPYILEKTGSTVRRNQQLTVQSFLELSQLAPDVPWLPEVQGWEERDYYECVGMYASAGVDLATLPAVGVGSICRRQGTREARRIVAGVAAHGIKVHGFGVKNPGTLDESFASADSFAWSYGARKRGGLCPHGVVRWETNCPHWLRSWRDNILTTLVR